MDNKKITDIITSQYAAGLEMLRSALDKVSEEQWNSEEYKNPIWQIAYHTLYITNLYLEANYESYVPFKNAILGAERLGELEEWEDPDEIVVAEGSHTKDEIFSFIDEIEDKLQERVERLPLEENSGFEWYPCSRLELHFNSIRHIQHHTAQIIERLKSKGIKVFPWWITQNETI